MRRRRLSTWLLAPALAILLASPGVASPPQARPAAPPRLPEPVRTPDGAFAFALPGGAPRLVSLRLDGPGDRSLDRTLTLTAGAEQVTVRPPVEGAYAYRVEVVELRFGAPRPIGGSGRGPGRFRQPGAMTWTPDGSLAVADGVLGSVQLLTPEGRFRLATNLGGRGSGRAVPVGLATEPSGRLWALDEDGRLYRVSPLGRVVERLPASPELRRARGLAPFPGRQLAIALPRQDEVVLVDSRGQLRRRIGGFGDGAGRFRRPVDVAVDANGSLWVAEAGNRRVQKLQASGRSEGFLTGSLREPCSVALGPRGLVYVADARSGRVHVFSPEGAELTTLQEPRMRRPEAVVVGPDRTVYVSDSRSELVWAFPASGDVLYKNGQDIPPSVR